MSQTENKAKCSANLLVIDGAYLQLGAIPLEKATNSRLNLFDAANVGKIIDYIQGKLQKPLAHRHMITAEMNQVGKEMRKDMYNAFRKNAVSVDIRGTKKKQVYCPSSSGAT